MSFNSSRSQAIILDTGMSEVKVIIFQLVFFLLYVNLVSISVYLFRLEDLDFFYIWKKVYNMYLVPARMILFVKMSSLNASLKRLVVAHYQIKLSNPTGLFSNGFALWRFGMRWAELLLFKSH